MIIKYWLGDYSYKFTKGLGKNFDFVLSIFKDILV